MNRAWLIRVALAAGGLTLAAGCAPKPVRVALPPPTSPPTTVAEQPQPSPPPVAPAEEAPTKADRGETVETAGRGAALPDIDYVNERLSAYEGKLFRWRALTEHLTVSDGTGAVSDEWRACLSHLEQTFAAYRRLQDTVLGRETAAGARPVDVWETTGLDVDYLESGCGELYRAEASRVVGSAAKKEDRGAELAKALLKAAGRARYQEVIRLYEQLQAASLAEAPALPVKRAYGLALLRTGKLEEARQVLTKVVDATAEQVDRAGLERVIADLRLASGETEAARAAYEQLAERYAAQQEDARWVAEQLSLLQTAAEQPEAFAVYTAALRAYLTFDGRRVPGELKIWTARLENAFPDSPYAGKARELLQQVEDEAKAWISAQLLAVDKLVAAKEYRQAVAALEGLLADDLPPTMTEVVQKMLDDTLVAEVQAQEARRQQMAAELDRRWEEAQHLLDSERFDAAIELYTSLFNTDYDVRARLKIDEAAERAAAELRRQAAGLFFKASRSDDPAARKELLRDSWQLLHQILTKYPQVSLIDKVRQNLQSIEEELRRLDPELLNELLGQEGAQAAAGPSGEGAPSVPASSGGL